MKRSPAGPETETRFWAKVEKTETCWLWTGALAGGYARFWWDDKNRQGHRLAYELLVGPIPDGLDLDHLCHNSTDCSLVALCPHRRCVNPAHLEPVTRRENLLRGKTIIATQLAKGECPQGHPYEAENLWVDGRGGRHCRTCHASSVARFRRRRTDMTRRGEDLSSIPHGKRSGYCNFGCRCGPCAEAQRAYKVDYRARQKAAS